MAEESSSVFREDRSWMYTGRRSRDSITPEWAEKTTAFVERAFRRVPPDHAARGVLCPCARCGNTRPRSRYDMQMHLCKNGFRPGYTVWVYHGEPSDDHGDDNGDIDGNTDAELVDFLGENGESSRPQGAMKREISLIQEYAYSKLRKEDQIEWNYQKYLREKEKLWQQSAPRLLEELKRQRLVSERRALKAERQLVEQREVFERRAKQFQGYEYFMANLYSCAQAGTQLPPMPSIAQLPPIPRFHEEARLAYEKRCEQEQAYHDYHVQHMTKLYSHLQARLQDGTPLALPPMPEIPSIMTLPEMPTLKTRPPSPAPYTSESTGSNEPGGGPFTYSPITPRGSTSSSRQYFV